MGTRAPATAPGSGPVPALELAATHLPSSATRPSMSSEVKRTSPISGCMGRARGCRCLGAGCGTAGEEVPVVASAAVDWALILNAEVRAPCLQVYAVCLMGLEARVCVFTELLFRSICSEDDCIPRNLRRLGL